MKLDLVAVLVLSLFSNLTSVYAGETKDPSTFQLTCQSLGETDGVSVVEWSPVDATLVLRNCGDETLCMDLRVGQVTQIEYAMCDEIKEKVNGSGVRCVSGARTGIVEQAPYFKTLSLGDASAKEMLAQAVDYFKATYPQCRNWRMSERAIKSSSSPSRSHSRQADEDCVQQRPTR
jgi:hypothetical protein